MVPKLCKFLQKNQRLPSWGCFILERRNQQCCWPVSSNLLGEWSPQGMEMRFDPLSLLILECLEPRRLMWPVEIRILLNLLETSDFLKAHLCTSLLESILPRWCSTIFGQELRLPIGVLGCLGPAEAGVKGWSQASFALRAGGGCEDWWHFYGMWRGRKNMRFSTMRYFRRFPEMGGTPQWSNK